MSDKINYTAEDIALYLEGKMSPAQMHAMEKAALTDPFLADAIEGMEMHGDKEKFNADVEELHARLAARAKNRKGAPGTVSSLWWKVAAVLIIVITGVAIITFTGEKNKSASNEIAKTETVKRETTNDTAAAQSKQEEQLQPATKNENLQGLANRQKVDVKIAEKDKHVEQSELKEKQVDKLKGKAVTNYPTEDAEAITRKDEPNVAREIASAKKPSAAAAPAADTVSQMLQGRVAGVAVDNVNESDSMFDEVIVIGYGKTKKNNNSKSKAVSAGRAEKRVMPGNGWDRFEQYIEDSTKINTADSVYTGEEHLSFTIGDDGLPESIKILRSISPSHDREAIRLLQNGPLWRVTKGKKREIRLKIIF